MTGTPVRWAGAFALAVSFTLPQTSCHGYLSPEGEFVPSIPPTADSSLYTPHVDRGYVIEEMSLGSPTSWLWPVVFFWPLGLLVLRRWRRWGRRTGWVWLELPFIAGTAYYVFDLAFEYFLVRSQAWGNQAALLSIATYAVGWGVDVTGWTWGRFRRVTAATPP